MVNNAHITSALQREFPAPLVNPEWVAACTAALLENGMEASPEQVRHQYLHSDLAASTLSNVIPAAAHDITLFPKPTLLHIVSITEIGSSAFQLQTVLEQRKEVISGATRIRRMDDEEEGDGEGGGHGTANGIDRDAEGEDKLPQYPRGMLKLLLTDGARAISAIEYKRIPGLKLGETCLGAKLLLHKVRALRGTLLLAPATTQCLGYDVANLEAEQPATFLNSLNVRMSKAGAIEGAAIDVDGGRAPAAQPAARRARPPARTGPTSTGRLTLPPDDSPSRTTPASNRRRALPEPVASPYFSIGRTARPPPATGHNSTSNKRSRNAAPARIQAIDDGEDEFDEFDDSFIRQLDEVEAMAAGATSMNSATRSTGSSRAAASAQVEYADVDDTDDSWFAEVDMDELDSLAATASARPASGSGSGSRRGRIPATAEIIEISD